MSYAGFFALALAPIYAIVVGIILHLDPYREDAPESELPNDPE